MSTDETVSGYEKLQEILEKSAALVPAGEEEVALKAFLRLMGEQSSLGKGLECHANGRSWMEQPIMDIQRAVGGGFALGQALKKVQEAERQTPDRAFEELKGAGVYLAGYHAMNEEIAAYPTEELVPVPDPGAMAEVREFQDCLRQIHQIMFCSSYEEERAACRRAIVSIAKLATCLADLPE